MEVYIRVFYLEKLNEIYEHLLTDSEKMRNYVNKIDNLIEKIYKVWKGHFSVQNEKKLWAIFEAGLN
jgi:predicted AlkP superfamily pyrophosphatase or phosphodiesterase